jgi:hypothetical protein
MAHKLKIELQHSDPLIYRTVIVPENFSFHQLHLVIQGIMNWENYHIYQFNTGAPYASDSISLPEPDEEDFDSFFGNRFNTYDSSETFLSDLFNGQKKKLNYIYDFGDDWIHVIKLLKKPEEEVVYPKCIKGENAAPIEDCGGISGFYHLLDVLNNQGETKEKKELLNWLGISGRRSYEDEFEFEIDEVNKKLLDIFT